MRERTAHMWTSRIAPHADGAPGARRGGRAARNAARAPLGRALLAVAGLLLGVAAVARSHAIGRSPAAPPLVAAVPPATAGIPAAGRKALLERYAPTVLLAPGEQALPASVDWYLTRSRLVEAEGGTVVTAAWRLGAEGEARGRLRPAPSARGGSPWAQDWTVYGHAYRAADGGILLQYWFFYAYNDFHGFGDHEADWEHVTVRLSPTGRPLGAWYARHDENAPGVWYDWDVLAREGAHPVVLAARGSHASYTRPADVAWFDEACPTFHPDRAEAWGCRVWRSWDGSAGGVFDLGTRRAPTARFVLWPGRWGADGGIADLEGGPPGPAFQEGWCAGGAPGCG